MVASATVESGNVQYDWAKEVKEFEDTKAGVKGLSDSGATKIPRFFVHPPESLQNSPARQPNTTTTTTGGGAAHLDLPTIDFWGAERGGARRREVVEEIREAASTWGFFRMVNHGVPVSTTDSILEAVRRFHEQPAEAKKDLYSNEGRQRVRFSSNVPTREIEPACWRDLLSCVFQDDNLDLKLIPLVCRKEVQEYVSCMIKVREMMSEILSEALGLSSDYLSSSECMKSQALACLYYPVCPEPNRAMGNARHSDGTFLTILLQDSVGGLQILHQNQWVDVPPVHGSLIANIGDLMQMISNDKFKSVEHRVLAQQTGSRVSVACFFHPSSKAGAKTFGPIKELLSEENPPIYREFICSEYIAHYKIHGLLTSALPHYKL